MSMSDPLADMLTRIRNGQRVNKETVSSPASNMRQRVLDVLEREGFIRGYIRSDDESGKPQINIELKYHEGSPVIREIKRIFFFPNLVFGFILLWLSCLRLETAWVFLLYQPQKVFSPILKLALRMLVARSSAQYSKDIIYV